MPTYNEIRALAQNVSSNRNALQQNFTGNVDNKARALQSNWNGELGNAYKDSYSRVRNNVSSFISDFGTLSTKLNKLADSVRRAERDEGSSSGGFSGNGGSFGGGGSSRGW